MNATIDLETRAINRVYQKSLPCPAKIIGIESYLATCQQDLGGLCFSVRNAHLAGYLPQVGYLRFLENRLLVRADLLAAFYTKLNQILAKSWPHCEFDIAFLNGDSHNGAQRPILLQSEDQQKVLKITDPRTLLVYNEVLQSIQRQLDLPSHFLAQDFDDTYSYQLCPYLSNCDQTSTCDEAAYGFSLGIHLALSYFLEMTDLHFENILAHQSLPYIIDTECMFYRFHKGEVSSQFRLMNTGLVAPRKSLSGIGGGTNDILNIELNVDGKGHVRYTRKNENFRNRITDSTGEIVSTDQYKHHILDGFTQAYRLISKQKIALLNQIDRDILDNLKTRFLIRTTAHYKTVIDRIYSPNKQGDHESYLNSTLSLFSQSGYLPDQIHNHTLEAEIKDVINADIPFFWVSSSGQKLHHRTGTSFKYANIPRLRDRIQSAISSFSIADLDPLSELLENHI